MEYKEYGSKNNDTIILLHGGGLSWWNYIDEIGLLEDEFHIVIPILDGHSNSDTNFTSIESNALEIINFINDNYNGKVKLIGGLSLGGQILLEILSKNPNICEYAIVESALAIPMNFTYKMIEPTFNLSRRRDRATGFCQRPKVPTCRTYGGKFRRICRNRRKR